MQDDARPAEAIQAFLQDDRGGGCIGLVVPDNLDQVEIAAGSGGLRALCASIGARIAQDMPGSQVLDDRDGTRFVVLMPGMAADQAGARMAALLGAIPACRLAVGAESLGVTARGAVVAAELVSPRTPARALQLLEAAAWIARTGQEDLAVLGPGDGPRLTAVELGARLLTGLPAALDDGRVVLLAQEIVSLDAPPPARREYEVLVQVRDALGLAHSPGELIRNAENSHLIALLDRWVIRAAIVGHAALMHRAPHVDLSLNISGRTLGYRCLWGFVARTLVEAGVPARRIQFEITETSAIHDMAAAQANVRAARAAGCRVALDDFGAGLSGLAYLKSFELDGIKIDGDLIPNVADPARIESEIVPSVIRLGRQLGLEVVTEHVARRETLEVLRDMGVDKVQGYLFGLPRPLGDVLREQADIAETSGQGGMPASGTRQTQKDDVPS